MEKYCSFDFDIISSHNTKIYHSTKKIKVAIISGIESNLRILNAVLDDIQKHKVDKIFCLGDVVGDGPNSRECLEVVRKNCRFSTFGCREELVCFDSHSFPPDPLDKLSDQIGDQLNSEDFEKEKNYELWDILGSMHKKVILNDILYVHASPHRPTSDYIFPKDVENKEKIDTIFEAFGKYDLCFCGHTHIPGVFTEDYRFFDPEDLDHCFVLNSYSGKKLVNVGSIVNPGDKSQQACYLIFDGESVQWIYLPSVSY